MKIISFTEYWVNKFIKYKQTKSLQDEKGKSSHDNYRGGGLVYCWTVSSRKTFNTSAQLKNFLLGERPG